MNAIIFGVDGTIFDTQSAKSGIFSQYVNELWGINPESAEQYWKETIGGPRREKFEYFHREIFGTSVGNEEYEKINSEFGRRLEFIYDSCDFISGVPEALLFSKENFDKIFAITGTPQKEMEEAFKKRNIMKYFDHVYGTDEVFSDKRAQLADITSKYKPSQAILVSHSKEDIEAGAEFGCFCIGITSVFPRNELRAAGAQEMLPDLSRLPEYLEGLLR